MPNHALSHLLRLDRVISRDATPITMATCKTDGPIGIAPSETSASAAIRFAVEQRGLTRRDLDPFICTRARVAEVLNNKRSLTLRMIRRLHTGLGIPVEALIS